MDYADKQRLIAIRSAAEEGDETAVAELRESFEKAQRLVEKMENIKIIIIAVAAAAALFAVLIFPAKIFISSRAARQKSLLGFDWKYIRDSRNFFNALGRILAELKFAHQRFIRGSKRRSSCYAQALF
jgi:hypothetical protein